MSYKNSGAVRNRTGWSQSGQLVTGNSASKVLMQVRFDEDQESVHTIQFGVGPATALAVGQQTVQPSPSPPNPPLVGTVAVVSGSTLITFQDPQTIPAGTAIRLASQPTTIYTILASIVTSVTANFTTNYNGPSATATTATITATAPVPAPAAAPGPPQAVDVVAIIQFTVEGNKVQRIITIGNGTSISGPGQALQVIVLDNTSAEGSPLGFAYNVSIQVTSGVRAAIQPPTLFWSYPPNPPGNPLAEQAVIAPGGTLTVSVPQNAGVNSFTLFAYDQAHNGTAPNVTAFQQFSPGNFVAVSFLNPPNANEFIPLVPTALSIVLQNNGADDIGISLLWGIDG